MLPQWVVLLSAAGQEKGGSDFFLRKFASPLLKMELPHSPEGDAFVTPANAGVQPLPYRWIPVSVGLPSLLFFSQSFATKD